MAQAVESDAREFGLGQEPPKVFADLRAPKRQAALARKDELVGHVRLHVRFEHVGGPRTNRDETISARLGSCDDERLALRVPHASPDRTGPVFQVNVGTFQCEQFALSRATVEGEEVQRRGPGKLPEYVTDTATDTQWRYRGVRAGAWPPKCLVIGLSDELLHSPRIEQAALDS